MSRRIYAYMWEYVVDPGKVGDFERLYGPEGDWAELSGRSSHYLRTELLRDRETPGRFVTVDYWESKEDWDAWRAGVSAEFEELDRIGESLTLHEMELGRFECLEAG